jgi:hypothetical protein
MIQYTGKFKTEVGLRFLVSEKLQSNMLSGHVGILHVMCFDEGFACTPDGGLVVDCVDSGDSRWEGHLGASLLGEAWT